ncbi:MAG TPA: MBG domain-containing protein, partial [Puia sp.]|nr:MBG domain-containing protein [Puia sp.]
MHTNTLSLRSGPKPAVFFMQQKKFILTAFLIGLSTLLTAGGPAQLVFSPTTIPDGLYGSAYKTQDLKVTGGKAPYSFSISGGSLPPGMSLSGAGVISGTPIAAGAYSFAVTALDNTPGPGRLSGSQNYTLKVGQASLTITANDATATYGGAVPALTASYSGFVNGDNISHLTTRPALSTTATSSSPA